MQKCAPGYTGNQHRRRANGGGGGAGYTTKIFETVLGESRKKKTAGNLLKRGQPQKKRPFLFAYGRRRKSYDGLENRLQRKSSALFTRGGYRRPPPETRRGLTAIRRSIPAQVWRSEYRETLRRLPPPPNRPTPAGSPHHQQGQTNDELSRQLRSEDSARIQSPLSVSPRAGILKRNPRNRGFLFDLFPTSNEVGEETRDKLPGRRENRLSGRRFGKPPARPAARLSGRRSGKPPARHTRRKRKRRLPEENYAKYTRENSKAGAAGRPRRTTPM